MREIKFRGKRIDTGEWGKEPGKKVILKLSKLSGFPADKFIR